MYPQKLMVHPVPEFMHHDCFTQQNGPVRVYDHEKDFPIGLHSHSFYEINIVLHGTGRHYIENNNCAVHPGAVFVLPPEIRHGYWEQEELSIFHILLSCAFMERFQKELHFFPGFSTLFEIEPMLRQANQNNLFLILNANQLVEVNSELNALRKLEKSSYPGASVIKYTRTLSLIGMLCQYMYELHASPVWSKNPSSMVFMEAMEYIYQNFTEKLSVDRLAARANMSRSTFLRGFYRLAGCAPIQYQQSCRLLQAKERMRCTNDSITQISIDCGFYDVSQFDRLFLRAEGITPREYRRSCMQKGEL